MNKVLKTYLLCLVALISNLHLHAQPKFLHRIILIGDAGEMDAAQKAVIEAAADSTISGKTIVLNLGDNIYPTGMPLEGTAAIAEAHAIMKSQFTSLRKNGATVYFIPGNHDWDRSGPDGLAKVKAQNEFLRSQCDSLLQMYPKDGCPGPDEIPVNEKFTIIAFDSEWWLYPFTINNEEADCACSNKEQFIESLNELLYKNRNKVILIAAHHPFKSYGRHGGYFSLEDHLFPLTKANKNLYIPLPIVGSLYPLLRRTFSNPEDIHHPAYTEMVSRITEVTSKMPNVIFAAGHEHTLQFIQGDFKQIVSGAGSKESYVQKDKAAFATNEAGFVMADIYDDGFVKINFQVFHENAFTNAFQYDYKFQNKTISSEQTITTTADSIVTKAYSTFDAVGSVHRFLFGDNYRREYGTDVKLPVINISTIKGGLTPYKRGGGNQSRSLRLKDKSGKEWVLRSVEKYPDVLLPQAIRNSFASDVVKDAMSAQHPYSALAVPVIAAAAGVPHSNPMIGYVNFDTALGIYNTTFAGTLCLLEEREPMGKSDNTAEMLQNLNADNDNRFDTATFFRARLLDVLLGDWDRHEDQWRWRDTEKGNGKKYTAVPRDRDQVFHVMQGVFPKIISRPWLVPFLHDFSGDIKKINAFFFESRNLNSRFLSQMDRADWINATEVFAQQMSDSLFELALHQLPPSLYTIRHDSLLRTLQNRRNNLQMAMMKYYAFSNRIVDIHSTDKNEYIAVSNDEAGRLQVTMHKLNKEGKIKDLLYSRTFLPAETKEIRFFLRNGSDSIYISNANAPVKMRFVGGTGNKAYHIKETKSSIRIYEGLNNARFYGSDKKVHKKLSNDSADLAVVPTNLYHVTAPVLQGGFNYDDGLLLGIGVRHTHRGFRKTPFASRQFVSFVHAFATEAFRIKYQGEWINTLGKADIVLKAIALAPDNTQNFFGAGNQTPIDKTGDYIRFYRTRYSIVQIDPTLRWRGKKTGSFSAGLSFQWYSFDSSDNKDRLINNRQVIKTYDSASINSDKLHGGLAIEWINDSRNSTIIPQWGSVIQMKLVAYAGLNNVTASFLQWQPQVSLYKSVGSRKNLVFANRLGGVISVGRTAFYQSAFLGGHDNLLGYRQYRFAGNHAIFNNFETRIKIADFASYIVPGQFGLVGFFDVGRVWLNGEDSKRWHMGYGGGVYLAPAGMVVLQLVAARSIEGWFPNISFGFRF